MASHLGVTTNDNKQTKKILSEGALQQIISQGALQQIVPHWGAPQNNKEDICVRDTSDDKKIYVSKIHRIIMKMYIGAQENLHNQQEKTHKFI